MSTATRFSAALALRRVASADDPGCTDGTLPEQELGQGRGFGGGSAGRGGFGAGAGRTGGFGASGKAGSASAKASGRDRGSQGNVDAADGQGADNNSARGNSANGDSAKGNPADGKGQASHGRRKRGTGLSAADRSPLGKAPDLDAIIARQRLGLPLAGRLRPADVTRAWKLAAADHHPDRGGRLDTMQAVNTARDLLLGRGVV
jgi:hypothetical protein